MVPVNRNWAMTWSWEELHMGEDNQVTSEDRTSLPTSGGRRRFLAGLVTGGLLGSILASGAGIYARANASPAAWFAGGRGERAAFAIDWTLHRIDAAEEQRQQIQTIAQAALKDLLPLGEQHRQYRQALREALIQPTINRDTLEGIRGAALQLADTASSRLVEAIADAAEVLTAEQRIKLAELVDRRHRHARWH
jgi:periplasmic protein CpxP/Spy